jgi:hypothetical protein
VVPYPLIALVVLPAEDSRPHRLYAKPAHHPECDDADQHDAAADQSTKDRLTLKTVAIVQHVVRQKVVIAEPVLLSAATPDRIRTC